MGILAVCTSGLKETLTKYFRFKKLMWVFQVSG